MKGRLLSIDVLRGMTIFFMIVVNDPGSWNHVYAPLRHAKWHGCTPTDLVFPFFLFIVGVSMAFSFVKYQDRSQSEWIQKVVKRTALIFLVGLLLNWFPFYYKNIVDLRILGVLQRIALAFGGAGLLIILIKNKRALAITAGGILFAYWGLLYFGGSGDPYSLEGNLATWFDTALLGESHVYGGFGIPFDPEGLISTIPGIAHVIIGYFIGIRIQNGQSKNENFLPGLMSAGAILVALGLIWHQGFPINKPLWTSSYVLLSTGLGTLLLGVLVWVIDVQGWKKWTYVFRVFGLNPLASYVLSGLFVKLALITFKWNDTNLYAWLYNSIFQPILGNMNGSLAFALTYTFFIWLFAWWLYRRQIVIKL